MYAKVKLPQLRFVRADHTSCNCDFPVPVQMQAQSPHLIVREARKRFGGLEALQGLL